MMESKIKIGLKKSRNFGLLLMVCVAIFFAIAWFYAEPYSFNEIEIFGIAYTFGIALGVMGGRDIIRIEVKDLLQDSSETKEGKP